MKIVGFVKTIRIDPVAAGALKTNEDVSFFAIPNTVLDKFHAKIFNVIDSDNELILVAQTESQATSENNPTAKKVVS